jgi:hypothetical protein
LSTQVENSAIKITNEKIELLINIFNFTSKISIFFGFLIIFSYLSMIQFTPQGVAIGDIIVFIFAFLGFSIFLTIGILLSAANLLWILGLFQLYHNFRIKRWERDGTNTNARPKGIHLKPMFNSKILWGTSSLTFTILAIFLFDIYKSPLIQLNNEFNEIWSLIWGFLIAGFFILLFFVAETPVSIPELFNSSKTWLNLLCMLFFVIILALMFGNWKLTLKSSMMISGLYQKNIAVELSPENYKRLNSIAINMGIGISPCLLFKSENYLVSGVNILWHGIGSRALLEVHSKKNEKLNQTDVLGVEMDNSGIWIVNSKIKPKKCGEIK